MPSDFLKTLLPCGFISCLNQWGNIIAQSKCLHHSFVLPWKTVNFEMEENKGRRAQNKLIYIPVCSACATCPVIFSITKLYRYIWYQQLIWAFDGISQARYRFTNWREHTRGTRVSPYSIWTKLSLIGDPDIPSYFLMGRDGFYLFLELMCTSDTCVKHEIKMARFQISSDQQVYIDHKILHAPQFKCRGLYFLILYLRDVHRKPLISELRFSS